MNDEIRKRIADNSLEIDYYTIDLFRQFLEEEKLYISPGYDSVFNLMNGFGEFLIYERHPNGKGHSIIWSSNPPMGLSSSYSKELIRDENPYEIKEIIRKYYTATAEPKEDPSDMGIPSVLDKFIYTNAGGARKGGDKNEPNKKHKRFTNFFKKK